MNIPLGLLLTGLLLAHTSAALAEVIELNSGERVEGKILKQDKGSILVDVGIETPVTYFRDEIKSISTDAPAAAKSPDAGPRADDMEAQAVELIDDGKMNQGLDLIRQALLLSPTPQRHLNYGSILFGNGVEAFKSGQREQGKQILREAEGELKKAVDAFDKDADAIFAAQAYFLLGEMYANAFEDTAKAVTFYQKSIALSGHEGAKAALQKINSPPAQ